MEEIYAKNRAWNVGDHENPTKFMIHTLIEG